MKSYIKLMVAVGILFVMGIIIAAILSFVETSNYKVGDSREISTLNSIARTAEESRFDLSVLDKESYDVDFVILDLTDNVLYSHSSRDISSEHLSIETAMQRRYPYEYLTDDGKVWGTVILLNDGMNGFRQYRNKLMSGLIICSILILLGMTAFGLYVNKHIIVPFNNLQDFAGKVAQGKLDEPLRMDQNNMFGAFSESFDIMREELAESKKRELELQKKERELVASLSHDLKTPVTGIKLTSELLQMRLSVKEEAEVKNVNTRNTEETRKSPENSIAFSRDEIDIMSQDAKGIYQKAEQIDALVSDLFTSTLDDLGEFKVSLADEEAKILGDIIKSYDDKGLVVTEAIPEVIINIDKKRMAQVIGNVISNSYKYANTKIDIDYRVSEGFLEMQIRDYGPGVPSDELDLITNKFYRGKSWQDTDKDGNGLGLYISKTLMKKMNGDLITESDGEGLAITLIIPLS